MQVELKVAEWGVSLWTEAVGKSAPVARGQSGSHSERGAESQTSDMLSVRVGWRRAAPGAVQRPN